MDSLREVLFLIMSILYGYLNLINKPVEDFYLRVMQESLKIYSYDKNYYSQSENSAIGIMQKYNTEESLTEKFPLVDGSLHLFASARIDNRESLIQLLFKYKDSTITDAAIILKAYKKWGNDCVLHLKGDWSFALFDASKKKLLLARDHHGNTSMYYYAGSDMFYFCSLLKGILVVDRVDKQINSDKISKILLAWHENGKETCYRNIYRLPPAHYLTIEDGYIDIKKYWFPETIPTLKLGKLDDYYAAFREVFSKAVYNRLRGLGETGLALSSGLDSSAIAAFAAPMLQQKNKSLYTFTSIPNFEVELLQYKNIPNEKMLASKTAAFLKNITPTWINSAEASLDKSMDLALEIFDEPMHAASNLFWMLELCQSAREQKIGNLLTGQGGNGTISWPSPAYFKYRESKKIQFNAASILSINQIRKNILYPIMPLGMRNTYRKWKSGNQPYFKYSFISKEHAKNIQLAEKIKNKEWDPWFLFEPDMRKAQISLLKPGSNIVGSYKHARGAYFGIQDLDPTFDKDVIEFCLSLPERVIINDHNDRLLIREGLKNMLPDDILTNQRRGIQASDISFRIINEREIFKSHLTDIQKIAGDFLDIPRIHSFVESLYTLNPASLNSSECGGFMRAIMIYKFLKRIR